MRWILAVVLSSVAVYMWGFAFYAQSKLPEKVIQHAEDHDAAGEALKEHFPENGVYYYPKATEDKQQTISLYKAGPIAIVHMIKVNGGEMMDTGLMISGFCHIMLTCIFLCLLLAMINASLPTWFARLRFFIFVGFLIAFYADIGTAVWWKLSWSWQLVNALHDWGAISIAGLVIATIAPFPKKSK